MKKGIVKEVELTDGRKVDVEIQSLNWLQNNNCLRKAMKKMTAATAAIADVEVDQITYLEWMVIESIVSPGELKSLQGLALLEPESGNRLRDEVSKLNFVSPSENRQSGTA